MSKEIEKDVDMTDGGYQFDAAKGKTLKELRQGDQLQHSITDEEYHRLSKPAKKETGFRICAFCDSRSNSKIRQGETIREFEWGASPRSLLVGKRRHAGGKNPRDRLGVLMGSSQ